MQVAVYGSGNMDRMRMEAVRRSQEMHRRSQPSEPVPEIRADVPKIPRNDLSDLLGKLLPDGKPDSDTLLIGALIWLLYKEGADIKLLLALAYILL